MAKKKIDNKQDETKKSKKLKNLIFSVYSIIIVFAICFNIYYSSIYYTPTKKKTDKSNIFDDNKISISEEEAENIINHLNEVLNLKVQEDDIDEYLVLDAIIKNDDFDEKKEWLCYKIFDLLKENPYLVKEDIYKSLLNVAVSYKQRPSNFDESTSGVYYYFFNSIGVFTGEEDLETFFHEVIHCIFSNSKTLQLPRFFREGMTQLLTREYIMAHPFEVHQSYIFEVSAVKMLCEVTSSDTVLKAFTLGDMNYITDEMAELGITKEQAEETIKLLEKALDAYSLDKELNLELGDFYTNCLQNLESCIDAKYEFEHPNSISYYYNEMLFYNCLFKENAIARYELDIEKYGIDYKAYFCEETKFRVLDGAYSNLEDNVQNNKLMLIK